MAVWNVLVLCTGNSARSLLAESILNVEGRGRLRAFSAGSRPKGEPHPLAIELLNARGHDVSGLRSKSWDEFAGPGAPRMDLVVTVCDDAAGESCPYWAGAPLVAHWGIADPAQAAGSESERHAAFEAAYLQLEVRVAALLALPFETMDRAALRAKLAVIGALVGATERARAAARG
jgi:protein-tyrosine-phosphatase